MNLPRLTVAALLWVFLTSAAVAQTRFPSPVQIAVGRSLPLLQRSADTWFQRRGCPSCHHQGVGLLTVALAREKGYAIDEALFRDQLDRVSAKFGHSDESSLSAGGGTANYPFGHAYIAWGMSGAGPLPADGRMVVLANGIAGRQHVDGSWRSLSHRPPMEDSSITLTAVAARMLQLVPIPGREREVHERLERAKRWLAKTPIRSTEERAFAILAAAWLGERALLQREQAALISEQREDGGWAQIPTRSTDAYATGLALVALHQSGGLTPANRAYLRGVLFLMKHQQPDGTWQVETRRRLPGLPYFETGFPHGKDQFLSYAAAGWATMALILTGSPAPSRVFWPQPLPALRMEDVSLTAIAEGATPLHRAALLGDRAELSSLLDSGADPNTRTKSGLSPLMLAVHDPDRVQLLLRAGARADETTSDGSSALMMAAGYSGALASVQHLLAAGASLERAADGPLPPLLAAVMHGDRRVVDLLLQRGAKLLDEALFEMTALDLAVSAGDVEMVRHLIARGADVNRAMEEGGTVLHLAVLDGNLDLVRLLIESGASLEERVEGHTPLLAAALIDPGHPEIVRALLKAGADPTARLEDGTDVVTLAEQNRHPATELLREAAEAKGKGALDRR